MYCRDVLTTSIRRLKAVHCTSKRRLPDVLGTPLVRHLDVGACRTRRPMDVQRTSMCCVGS